MANRTLVIGFGNEYRRDDGVGQAVVSALHERLYGEPFLPEESGFANLGREVDMVVLQQLVPDLAEILVGYDLVIFVDAHVQSLSKAVLEQEVIPEYRSSAVTHHLAAGSLLALARDLFQAQPRGIILSIRAHDLDFGQGLSEPTAAVVPSVVERILTLIEG